MESREFGKYTLLEHVGKGGVGSVYRARNERDGATVAVKIFEPAGGRSADLTRRLRDREVRMLVSVQHPNIVKFHETGEVGEEYYYAMEFVENSLLKCLRGGREFRLAEKVRILRQSTSALAAIHHQGIVHRDVKPGNMLLDNGRGGAVHVKLTDLGIARRVRETEIAGGGGDGPVPGTPKYLSPEQIMRVRADGRADIFSLGVVAYELLTGELPFQAETPEEYAEANVEQTQAPAGELAEDLPGFLSDMVDRMLAKDREERYDSDTLEQDLRLAEQHLVSGAPLGENQNPVSIFYGGSPDEQPAESRPWPGGIHPVSWAAALLAVAAAAAAAWAAWPP
ncbi:MAG: serine/threonine-protein kinase, partial [Planctomycetota bacterium]